MTQGDPARLYAAVLAVSSTVFVAIAGAVLFWASADRLDVRAVNWVRRTAPDLLVDAMEVVTYAGSAVVLGPLASRRRAAPRPAAAGAGRRYCVVAAFAGSVIVSQWLKALFQRGRPELEDPVVQLTTYAFPSGHSFSATATYGALALVLASTAVERRHRLAALAIAAALILVVAASRVIVGRHFTLDVLAGIAGGVALLSGAATRPRTKQTPGLRFELFAGDEQPQRARLDS